MEGPFTWGPLDWNLQHLYLGSNNIGDEGAMAVARGLKGNLTLMSIDLSQNAISNAGVEALSLVLQGNTLNLDLSSCNRLDYLREDSIIDSTVFRRDLILPDTNSSQYCNLKTLSLSRNHCERDPLAIISHFKSLSYLNLSGNTLGISKVMSIVDYVAHSNNCKDLK